MKFYCINSNKENTSYLSFKEICENKKIKFVGLDPFNTNVLNLNVEKGDLVYCISDSRIAKLLEKEILYKGAIGFYKDPLKISLIDNGLLAYFENQALSSPKTISVLTCDRDILKEYVKHLGGFPIIIKVLGGSKGFGVIKVESFESLFSIIDYISPEFVNNEVVLKEFIEHDSHVRVIVLGDKVLFSYFRIREADDFRTNSKRTTKKVLKITKEIEDISIKAVKNMNTEFGGVDILIQNKTEKPYLAEVNFPCALKVAKRFAEQNNIRIEEEMLDFLIKKSEKI